MPSEMLGPTSFGSRETDTQCDPSCHLVVMLIKTPCGSHTSPPCCFCGDGGGDGDAVMVRCHLLRLSKV
ncbi:hypothetical protein A6R68_21504 [Neotoma lepida]|uniref:Uncharacterized protein n=1 Tax=Neotoma lepida TaxID=56216 RepID=A0A1A6HPX4_NEOLE|nr:hypothetical protein A6R68_21504 [Neotoma lepida]